MSEKNIIITEIHIPYFDENRKLRIYLPDTYNENDATRYPVIYMQDGQNIYTGETAFGGDSWGVLETASKMEKEGFEAIIVGIDNAQMRRADEYLPCKNTYGNSDFPVNSMGGYADQYADFFVNTLKKYIDETYKTKPDFDNTTICGSSMGGVISAYISAKYPDVFSKMGIFSLASWLCEETFLDYINTSKLNTKAKYYIQVGTNEGHVKDDELLPQMYINNSINYHKLLIQKGININNLHFGIGVGDQHNEKYWAKYVEDFFKF